MEQERWFLSTIIFLIRKEITFSRVLSYKVILFLAKSHKGESTHQRILKLIISTNKKFWFFVSVHFDKHLNQLIKFFQRNKNIQFVCSLGWHNKYISHSSWGWEVPHQGTKRFSFWWDPSSWFMAIPSSYVLTRKKRQDTSLRFLL